MKPVVLFGNGLVASLAHYYLTHDSPREVAGFTVDADHVKEAELRGLPVVPVDAVVERFPPGDFDAFVAVGYGRMNKFREGKYHQMKDLGYQLVSYVSSRASTWPDLQVGDNCFVMEGNLIQPSARIGNDVTMWGGSHLGHDSEIQDHVFVSSHSVISGYVTVGPNCFLGVNCAIRDEVTVARETVIGAGAVITKNTKERSVYAGPRPELLEITSDRLPRV